MEKELFSPMEIDALGEMMNISLGSSATAVSNMLDHRVDITTPHVTVVHVKDFVLGKLEPAMGVEIKYVEGLDGSNIMLLRRSDVKVIVDILMGSETSEEEFELNELTISAVCEVMNQMMGAAATAMSDFLGFPVNISTPEPFELGELETFKEEHLPKNADEVVVVRFSLKIENALESEFMNVMSVSLAKELLRGLGLGDDDDYEPGIPAAPVAPAVPTAPPAEPSSGRQLSQDEIEKLMAGMGSAAPAPQPEPEVSSSRQLSQDEIEKLMADMANSAPAPQPEAPAAAARAVEQRAPEAPQMPVPPPPQMPAMPAISGIPAQGQQAPPAAVPPGAYYPGGYAPYPPQMYWPYPPQQMPTPPEPKVINTQPVPMQEMELGTTLGKEQAENLDLIMEVPLQVTVEIGRTQRKVQDILEFSKGSLVVLDKLAGDQVDLFVNGKCIAKGDVVVIDDNFGVRITEIVQKPGIEASIKK